MEHREVDDNGFDLLWMESEFSGKRWKMEADLIIRQFVVGYFKILHCPSDKCELT